MIILKDCLNVVLRCHGKFRLVLLFSQFLSLKDTPCVDLPAPKNGAKACETWLAGGMTCTVHCNKGYGFANHPQPIYHCNAKGKWVNVKVPKKPAFPDCSSKKIRHFQ